MMGIVVIRYEGVHHLKELQHSSLSLFLNHILVVESGLVGASVNRHICRNCRDWESIMSVYSTLVGELLYFFWQV